MRLIDGRPVSGRFISPGAYEHYLRAQLHLQHGRLTSAATELRLALAFDPKSPYLHVRLGELLAHSGALAEAERHARLGLALEPSFFDGLLFLGKVLWQQRRHQEGEDVLRSCIRVHPRLSSGYLVLADLLEQSGEGGRARAVLQQMAIAGFDAAEAHGRLAQVCLRQADYRCAALELAKAGPGRATLEKTLQLGHVYQALGERERAIALLRRAFDISGGRPDVAAALVRLLEQAGELAAADDVLDVLASDALAGGARLARVAEVLLQLERPRRLLGLMPGLPAGAASETELRLAQADALGQLGQLEEARGLLEPLLEGPDAPRAALRLAGVLGRARAHREAEQLLRRALERHPAGGEDLAIALARALHRQGKHAEAAAELQRALARDQTNRRLSFALARALERAGRWREALALAQQLLKKNPRDASAHNFIGYTLADRNLELAAAERSIKRALYLQPGQGQTMDSLGWLYFRQGRLAEAREVLEIAVRLAPGEADVLGHLAEVLASYNDTKGAAELLRRAIEACDDEILETRFRQRLAELERRRLGLR